MPHSVNTSSVVLSERLRFELFRARANGTPQYRLALRAGIHPTTLSLMLNGGMRIVRTDERIHTLGRLVGLNSDECFSTRCEEIPA
jgi:hypothetical protein